MDRLIKKVVLLLASMSIVLGISGCVFNQSNMVDDLDDAGYDVVSDDGGFYVIENDAYYYFVVKNGKPSFSKVVKYIVARNSAAAADGLEGKVTIKKINWRRMDLYVDYPVYWTHKDGTKELVYDYETYRFKHNFDKENITNDRGFHDIKGDYESFCTYGMSQSDIQDYYDRGFELEEELREAIK